MEHKFKANNDETEICLVINQISNTVVITFFFFVCFLRKLLTFQGKNEARKFNCIEYALQGEIIKLAPKSVKDTDCTGNNIQ